MELLNEMSTAVDAVTSPTVKIWLNWMMIIFICSIFFTWHYLSARIIFVTFWLTLPLALVIFYFSRSAHLLGLAHIIFWGPLAVYLVRNDFIKRSLNPKSLYGVYLILLIATILISLVFDIRDTTLVSLGRK